jgi:putative transposase
VDPGNRSRVYESPQPAKLGPGLHHETHQVHSRADHPQAQNGRAADRPRQDRRQRLPRDRGDAADLPPLEAAVRGMQAEEARRLTQLEKENARLKKLLAEAELEKTMLKDLAEGNF